MTAQLTRCHVCHVFITRLVTCNTCDILATLIVVTLSTLFKHRGKDKLNTWKMPPLKLGFTGVNVKSAEDTIKIPSQLRQSSLKCSCGNSWLGIDMSSVSCEVISSCPRVCPSPIPHAGLMVPRPDSANITNTLSENRRWRKTFQTIHFAMIKVS